MGQAAIADGMIEGPQRNDREPACVERVPQLLIGQPPGPPHVGGYVNLAQVERTPADPNVEPRSPRSSGFTFSSSGHKIFIGGSGASEWAQACLPGLPTRLYPLGLSPSVACRYPAMISAAR